MSVCILTFPWSCVKAHFNQACNIKGVGHRKVASTALHMHPLQLLLFRGKFEICPLQHSSHHKFNIPHVKIPGGPKVLNKATHAHTCIPAHPVTLIH